MSMTEDVISIGDDNHAWNWSNIEPKLQNPKKIQMLIGLI